MKKTTAPEADRNAATSLDALASGVKAWREHHGWTQAELAHRAGITVSPISKIERRKNPNPEIGTLLALAHAFGLGTSIDLLARGPEKKRTRSA